MTLTNAIAKAENETRTRAERQADELAVAEQSAERFSILYEEAEAAFAEVESRLSSGDETVSVEDYAQARAALDRATLLRDSPERTIGRLRRAIPTDTQAAETVAAALMAVLPGLNVLPTFAAVSETPRTSELPVAVVSQTAPLNHCDGSGRIGGTVSVTMYRSPLHIGLDTHAVEAALEALGADGSARFLATELDGMVRESGTVTLKTGHAPVPVIPAEPTDSHADAFARLVSGDLFKTVRRSTTDVTLLHTEPRMVEQYAKVIASGVTSKTSRGKRASVVTARVEVKPRFHHGARGPIETVFAAAVANHVGLFEPWLGVVESAEVASMERTGGDGDTYAVTTRHVFASRAA